jgi:hypothetical protein
MSPYDLRRVGWKPHEFVIDSMGYLWELISYPYQNEGNDDVLVQIRQLNKPETARPIECAALTLFLIKPRILMDICKECTIVGFIPNDRQEPVIIADCETANGICSQRFYSAITGELLSEIFF